MRSLIDSVLQYSRLSQGNIIKTEINTQHLLEEVIKSLNILIEKSSTKISFENLPLIMGDENQLSIVFQNLIENAIKYCDKEHPIITISARERSDDSIVFFIKDNGKGIEKEYYHKVFQLFQRLDQNTTYSGTGIGLANVKKIIELHGGEIWIDSVVGEGTTFSFTLSKIGKKV